MNIKKIAIILAVMVSLSTLVTVSYKGARFYYQYAMKIETAFAFIEKTDRRHTQEDLIFLEKREQALIDRRLDGHQSPSDIDEMIRLKTQINELKRELGYIL